MDGIPKRDEIALVVIDVQEKFRPAISDFDKTVGNISKLIKAFKVFGIPIIHTQQYTNGLGTTIPELKELLESEAVEKIEFSCFKCGGFKEELKKFLVPDLIPKGRQIIECCLDNGTVQDYDRLI